VIGMAIIDKIDKTIPREINTPDVKRLQEKIRIVMLRRNNAVTI
jgi:hypothetical protein